MRVCSALPAPMPADTPAPSGSVTTMTDGTLGLNAWPRSTVEGNGTIGGTPPASNLAAPRVEVAPNKHCQYQ
jgi:hypothetical protein